MADRTLPQTKYCQKLNAFSGELPPYLVEFVDNAKGLGLVSRYLEDKTKYSDHIVLVLSGSKSQIENFLVRFCGEHIKNITWPRTTRAPCQHRCNIAPSRWGDGMQIYRIDDDRFAIQAKYDRPRSWSNFAEGIEYFDFGHDNDTFGYVAYVGERERLIDEGLASLDFFPDDTNGCESTETAGGFTFLVAATHRLLSGKWVYLKYPANIRKSEEMKDNEGQRNFANPDEWLETIEDTLLSVVNYCLPSDGLTAKSKAGAHYAIAPSHLEAIRMDISLVAQKIRGLPVKVQAASNGTASPAGRAAAKAAQADAAFQKFVNKLVA